MNQTSTHKLIRTLALSAALVTSMHSMQAAIESNFDDMVYPGTAGNGWVDAWQNTAVGSPPIAPEILTTSPIDNGSPYLHFDATGGTYRNLMRQYESGEGVILTAPHYIRWKFRLTEADFATQFTTFNDRIHFFSRTAPRLGGSTDASIGWSIMAAGTAHSSGAVAGQTFWVFDNVDGTGGFNLGNHVDTLVPVVPDHVYAFELFIRPDQLTYTVSIMDETSSASFSSSAPHRFRNLAAPGESQNYVHWGTQVSTTSEVRPYDIDSVSIAPWGGPAFVDVVPANYAISDATNGVHFNVVAIDPVPTENIGLTLNGANVAAQLNITGTETNRSVSYTGLAVDTVYAMILAATNASGTTILTQTFYTATSPFTLYNSGGFTSDVLYPAGPLQPVTDGGATWVPSTEPSEILDLFDGQYGKVLQRMNMGATRVDYLEFPPVSSGVITIEFDAWVSTAAGRTIDIALMPATGDWASHVGWGAVSEKLSYYSETAASWLPVADLTMGSWHHCKLIHYLSGAAAGRYDILVNDVPVAEKIPWRSAIPGTPLMRMSYQSHSSGTPLEYARIDNLILTAGPEDPNAFPTPTITNLTPAAYAVVRPTESLQFEVLSVLPITSGDISVLLNGSNITSGLTFGGTPNHLSVSYGPLGTGKHSVEITAMNGAGSVVTTAEFYATVDPLTIFDSGGFADDLLYPVGYLGAVTNGDYYWAPAEAPNSAEIVDLADGVYGKVLRRQQLGADYTDYLHFSPVSSGTVIVKWDARISSTEGRSMDMSLNSVSTGGGTQGPFIMWGTNVVNHYNGSAWVPVTPVDTAWHQFEMISYVSGPKAGTFDLKMDNALAGEALVWRNVFSPVGTLRIGAIRGTVLEYGEVDNLVIMAAPAPILALPVTLLSPAHSGSTFSFGFQSLQGVNYLAEYNDALGSTNWTTLESIQGDGTEKTVTHTNPPAGALFYRVQSVLP